MPAVRFRVIASDKRAALSTVKLADPRLREFQRDWSANRPAAENILLSPDAWQRLEPERPNTGFAVPFSRFGVCT